MPRRSQSSSKPSICVNVDSVDQFISYIFFYKANAVAILTSGQDLFNADIKKLVDDYNNYLGQYKKRKTNIDVLTVDDFNSCDVQLTSDELIEMKEYLKSSASPYKFKTSETLRTLVAFQKLARAADVFMSVRIGDVRYVMVVDIPPSYIASRSHMSEVNRRFLRLAGNVEGFTELYILANSLLALQLPNCNVSSRLIAISGKYYTSTPLSVEPLCRAKSFARFYVDLVGIGSKYTSYVASALLRYIQVGDRGDLYSIVRNMTQTERLTQGEREALGRLLSSV